MRHDRFIFKKPVDGLPQSGVGVGYTLVLA